MKKLLPILFVTVCVLQVGAQTNVYNNSTTHLKVNGGASYSAISGEDGVYAPKFGVGFDTRVSSQPVYVGAGVEYINKGYRHNSNHSLVMPFLGSYHIILNEKISVAPYAGTVISYGFNWEKWDYGLRLGCNIIKHRWDFTLGYYLGLRHYKFTTDEGRSKTLFFGIGYNFNLIIN